MAKRKRWIQAAINPKNKGALHRQLGVPEDEVIPKGKLRKAAKAKGKLGRRARLALILGDFAKGVRGK